ncbi:hypothetical protein DLH72_01465 [Candidatus Gracilibacteria bacterium]|nr:MAG: hypothetical protein DLH72_01465 [Candidatus Gracilibacteria bacterium]
MTTRRRGTYSNRKSFSNNIKDYIVPIIAGILILIIIYSFFKGNDKVVVNNENQTGISITRDSDSKATIFYTGGNKKELEDGMELFKGEKITVSAGRIQLKDSKASFNLNKLGELKYLENGDYSLYSGEVWIDTESPINLEMRFAKLKIKEKSHISLSQNEVNSTIHVVSGNVEVSNLSGKSTILTQKEKIEMSREEYSNEKVDLSIKKEPLNDYFLKSDWFLLNNGENYLSNDGEKETQTGTTVSTGKTESINSEKLFTGKSKYITFSNLLDESNVSSSSIVVSGAYDVEEVSKIELNGKVAILNPQTGTFKIEGVSVPNKSNDLVFKVFNKDEDLKEKFVYTVYYESGTGSLNQGSSDSGFKVNTFDVDGSKFAFTAPTTASTYSTYEDFITIRGYVSATGIDSVTVNDFKLNSFDGKNWRYHARTDYGNLANGTNVYEIKYFSGGNLVYKNHFTIIKKSNQSSNQNTNLNNKVENTEETFTGRTAD